MSEQKTVAPPLEGKLTVKVTNHGNQYCFTANTYTTESQTSMLISNYAMPEDMNKHVLERAISEAQATLAGKIANEIADDVEKLYREEVKKLAKKWARDNKEKIVAKLLKDAKADFMSRFEDYDD